MPAPGQGHVVDLATEMRKGTSSAYTVVDFHDTSPANFAPMIPTPFSAVTGGQYAGTAVTISGCDGVWAPGERVVGGTSGRVAFVMDAGGNAATGTATLTGVSGTFQSGEDVSSVYGAAYATTTSAVYDTDKLDLTIKVPATTGDIYPDIEGDTSGATATVASRILEDGELLVRGDAGDFTVSETITGQESGTTATVVSTAARAITKTGSLCTGEPETWDYSAGGAGGYAASTPLDTDTSDMGTVARNTTATCVAGVDTGIDPTTDWFRVTFRYHGVTWADYWTQSGPFIALDKDAPHDVFADIVTGWGHLRDQTVSANYMIHVWNIPIIYNMDADEYHNTDNGGVGNTPGVKGEWDVVIEGNEDGTYDISWDGTVLWGTGGVQGAALSLPTQYTTPTGVLGGMIVEIQNGASPGYRGYRVNPTEAGWLTTGSTGPIVAEFEYPGMTGDITIEW